MALNGSRAIAVNSSTLHSRSTRAPPGSWIPAGTGLPSKSRPRAVPALVGYLEPVILRKFLAGLDFEGNPVPAGIQLPGGALVEREFRVDEFTAIARGPFSA